ncbi:hypothetical protein PZA11_001394 [Diplocarpon coronariae]|uniref:Delta 8-(E)-sphingolipid desaturase n=1 Tax=Diplocarpon coronariae TaxID=2795749 RepID=A0A218Z2C4_9HELO|nr:fatty acid desaturase [Marssonina coronariae]
MASALKDRVLSPRHIHQLIDDGFTIVLLGRKVLKIPATWLEQHPGGNNIILHMIGRDATDEVNAFHKEETKRQMLGYQIGTVLDKWVNVTPPIQRVSRSLPAKLVEDEIPSIQVHDEASSVLSRSSSASSVRDIGSSSSSCILDDAYPMRRRRAASPASFATSISEDSDLDEDEKAPAEPEPEPDLRQDDGAPGDEEQLADITDSFRGLVAKLESRGLYHCNYWAYAGDVSRVALNFSIMLCLLRAGWYLTSAIFMGCFWHQLVFTAHDAGHKGITHNYHIDTLIGMTIGNYMGGLSMGWWKRAHNIHHVVTNDPAHDPDIEHLPFMAISPRLFQSLYSTHFDRVLPFNRFAQMMVPHQKWMYYPLLCFGRFNLYALSLEHLILDLGPRSHRWHRYYELAGQVFFWYWFGYWIVYCQVPTWPLRLAYVLLAHMITMPLHVQFTLSHFAMGTETPGPNEPWAVQQLRTTMDVACPTWMDWFHGGLQFQAVHHLFPMLPRHNLRAASEEVKVWSESVGIKYEIYGFQKCNGRVMSRLEEVGKQARMWKDCHQMILEKGDYMKGEWE